MNNISREVDQARLRYGIVGNDPSLAAAIERAVRVAPIDLSVLVTGESGTGKEFFPRIIHDFSSRKHNRYIAVNCGAIPEGTIDSELFGHEKGSFTGAVSSRKGYFEEANGGTIFLDEVAELPLTTQARLLRVLETGEYIKVGSSEVHHTDIRIVAATNVDMQRAIASGKFREDLFYRLSTVQINVPALRDRGNDIYMLARLFAAKFADRYSVPSITFTEDARMTLMSYRWPGNVRQLKNIIEQMALFEAGKEIDGNIVKSYLPQDREFSMTPATYNMFDDSRYEREREMLMGMLIGLQNELRELKQQINTGARQPQINLPESLRKTSDITTPDTIIEDITPHTITVESYPDTPVEKSVTDIVPYREPEPLFPKIENVPETLRDTERETIKRALERNNGVRKSTAKELSISERTLYRKIKEYGLE